MCARMRMFLTHVRYQLNCFIDLLSLVSCRRDGGCERLSGRDTIARLLHLLDSISKTVN